MYWNQLGDDLQTFQHTIITYIDSMSEDLLEKEQTWSLEIMKNKWDYSNKFD